MIGSPTAATPRSIDDYTIPKSHLTIHKDAPLGVGGFGIVCPGIWKGQRRVVFKTIPSSNDKERSAILTETKSWLRIKQHPFIVTLWGLSETDTVKSLKEVVLVLERMEMSLYHRLYADLEARVSFVERTRWISQTAAAMKYIHSLNPPVLHLDLKPDNILLDIDGNARISDIGIVNMKPYRRNQSRQAQYLFAPPESFGPKYKPHTSYDVYSFAMTVYQVLSGQGPFDDVFHATYEKVGRWVIEGYRPPRPSSTIVPAFCWALIEECWDQDPIDRPSFARVVEIIQNW
ncbi:UNVERIFIED_CONTAM: Receptor-interacting serine/threonine-protein kinase 4 [Siphonaria sp. JEL0065]|nr:Receptor-interacting serine/threonine-protein kinase 4 [Siphonaria sp. JEL0065]